MFILQLLCTHCSLGNGLPIPVLPRLITQMISEMTAATYTRETRSHVPCTLHFKRLIQAPPGRLPQTQALLLCPCLLGVPDRAPASSGSELVKCYFPQETPRPSTLTLKTFIRSLFAFFCSISIILGGGGRKECLPAFERGTLTVSN